jgi:flagella basal body P-ring formation protein FlgA
MLHAPKDVQRGDVVQVEVHSGAALLKLEGRAETAGRRGDAIRVHSLVTGRSFSARIADKNRVVVTTAVSSKTQDGSK